MTLRPSICALAAAMALTMAWPAPAHDGGHDAHHDAAAMAESARVKLLDLELVDADGRPRRFMSEVVEDRIVALSFIYTSCTTICPVMSAIFAAVQEEIGDRLGPEIRLVSISIDPATDIPHRLKRYAEQFGAGPGWTFLTGERSRVDQVLTGLGAYAPNFEDHPSMVLVGDARRNVWRRFYGFASPEAIVVELERLAAGRQDEPAEKEQPR
jgi:protein SCO1